MPHTHFCFPVIAWCQRKEKKSHRWGAGREDGGGVQGSVKCSLKGPGLNGGSGKAEDNGDDPLPHPAPFFSPGLCHSESPLWQLLAGSQGWVGCEGGRQAGREAYFSFWLLLHTHKGPWVSEHTPGQHPVNPDARSGLPTPSGSWAVSGPSPTSGNQEGRKTGLSPSTRAWGTGNPRPRMTVSLNLSPRCQNLPITSILRTIEFGGKERHTQGYFAGRHLCKEAGQSKVGGEPALHPTPTRSHIWGHYLLPSL